MGSFIHLFSSGDQARFPNNSPHSFRTRLDEPIRVEKNNSVSLHEISFRCNNNQFFTNAKLEIIDWNFYNEKSKKWGKLTVKNFKRIDLPSADALANVLNYQILKAVPTARARKDKPFVFVPENNRLQVQFPPKLKYQYSLKLHSELVTLVGFQQKHATKKQYACLGRSKDDQYFIDLNGVKREFDRTCRGAWPSSEEHVNYFKFPPQINIVSSIFVYTSICKESQIATSRGPLLRVVPIGKASDARKTVSFGSSLIKIPLTTELIDEIDILLTDLGGQPILFSSYVRLCLYISPPSL